MEKVFLLYGEKCGAEELLGIYSTYAIAASVGRAFVDENSFENYNIEAWKVMNNYCDAFNGFEEKVK